VLSDQPTDEEALAAFAAGARGYCNTHAASLLLIQIAAVVLQGGLWIGESLMQRLVSATSRLQGGIAPAKSVAWSKGLTDREKQVASTLARGASNKEIARALGITERTVKAHVGAILDKLQVRDRLQLSLIVNGRASEPG
jgi:DNA-binding NarL/FixJ family response regulator